KWEREILPLTLSHLWEREGPGPKGREGEGLQGFSTAFASPQAFQKPPRPAKFPAMFRPGWRFFPVPALAALFVLGAPAIGGLELAGIRASLSEAHAAAGFLSIAEDVPLMPGLAENADAAAVFDKPS